MIDVLGKRQQLLLRLLLKNKSGLTIDQLAQSLAVTRTAVRQHLAALTNDGLVSHGLSRPSGGRPEQLYILSLKGQELFPRQYSWLAEMMMDSIRQESGPEQLSERLHTMGVKVGEGLRKQFPELHSLEERVDKLGMLMEQLGYDVAPKETQANPLVIAADNCVFHTLAQKEPAICEFDLALLGAFTGGEVNHQECMAKGGNVCRFKFKPKEE